MAVYAFVSTSYPREPGDPGGHFVRTEAQRRAAEGHEVHVVCPGADRADGPVRVWGCGGGEAFGWPGALERLRQDPTRVAAAGAFCLRAAWRLRGLEGVDHFVAHFLVPSALLLPAGRATIEVVGHGSDVRLVAGLPALARMGLVGGLLRRGALFRFSSEAGRHAIVRSLPSAVADLLIARSRVELPAVDVPSIAVSARRRRRVELGGDRAPLIAICGRLVPAKRFHLALDVIGAIGASALVIGEGPARPALERRAAEAGVRARFVGRRSRPAALLDLSCADLLVHPSVEEGAPTVVREARALGVPVVCCPSGDLEAWAADDDELVVTGDDGLVEAVRASLARRRPGVSAEADDWSL